MRKLFLSLLFFVFFFAPSLVLAEDKSAPGRLIPKLEKTADDPELFNNFVYPMWGPVCQRYTYTVTYRDSKNRPPESMQIYFNGQMIDMVKTNPDDNNYQHGVRYQYQFVPTKIDSNFYYFEASNGLGKARASIIDSPDNGPVLFDTDFLDNQVVVVDTATGEKLINFPTQDEWIGGLAMSDNGRYTAVQTSRHIYFFDINQKDAPLWIYSNSLGGQVGGDLKGGIDISADGSKIIASMASHVLFFDSSRNQPLWMHDINTNAYNIAISADGLFAAAATGGSESEENTNLLILWDTKNGQPLWQYHSSGNFHDVSLSAEGSFISASTGCPDRRYYLFSKDSKEPLIRSEMLTRDSPVHRAKISANGQFSAVGSESDAGAVFLFSQESRDPVWKFSTPQNSSVRALNFTPDGRYIGAATLGGQAYIFDRDSNQPLATWQLKAALGGIDIADDGSFIIVGGSDKMAHILSADKKTNITVPFDEYVEEIDISADGRYAAIGTGGAVYFFETILGATGKSTTCSTIIEPKPLDQAMMTNDNQSSDQSQVRHDNIEADSDEPKLLGMLFGFAFLFFISMALIYFAIAKLSHRPLKQKIIIILLILAIPFLILTVFSAFYNRQKLPDPSRQEQTNTCGNNFCESDSGETKANCPQDCSSAD